MGSATGEQLILEGLEWWYVQITSFLASYGWRLLFSFFVGWWLKTEKFDPWWERRTQDRLMKEAQRKERVEVLDEDKKRVREKQFKTLVGKVG
jgi:cation diffusion facilitator CzcD-associated flavoprotein CzcO